MHASCCFAAKLHVGRHSSQAQQSSTAVKQQRSNNSIHANTSPPQPGTPTRPTLNLTNTPYPQSHTHALPSISHTRPTLNLIDGAGAVVVLDKQRIRSIIHNDAPVGSCKVNQLLELGTRGRGTSGVVGGAKEDQVCARDLLIGWAGKAGVGVRRAWLCAAQGATGGAMQGEMMSVCGGKQKRSRWRKGGCKHVV